MNALATQPFAIDWDLDAEETTHHDDPRGDTSRQPPAPSSSLGDLVTAGEYASGAWLRRAPRYLAPEAAATLPSWGDTLARTGTGDADDAGSRIQVRTLLEGLPADLDAQLAAAVSKVSGLQPAPGAVFGMVSRSGRRHRFELRGEVLRLGSGETCHLRLDDHDVPSEVAEVRIADAGPWLVPIDDSIPVLIGGQRVLQHRYCRLEVGVEIQLAGHRLVLEDWCRAARGTGVAVHHGEVQLLAADEDPFASFGDDALWAEVGVDTLRCFVQVPETWTALAYETLGEHPVPLGPMDQAIDRSLTRAMLRAVAHEMAADTGRRIELLRFASARQLAPRSHDGWCRWYGDLELHGRRLPTAVVWPRRTGGQRLLDPGRLRFSASVLAGSVALEQPMLGELERGDILVPDHWWSRSGAPSGETSSGEASSGETSSGETSSGETLHGPVLVHVQRFNRPARLDLSEGRARLRFDTAEWSVQHQGELPVMSDSMPVHDASQPTHTTEASLDEGLEVALSFELDRMTVSLDELGSWRAGAAVTLERTPTDSVRILLHHAGGQRMVGKGTVVRVDEQLGVRLDEWYPGGAS